MGVIVVARNNARAAADDERYVDEIVARYGVFISKSTAARYIMGCDPATVTRKIQAGVFRPYTMGRLRTEDVARYMVYGAPQQAQEMRV